MQAHALAEFSVLREAHESALLEAGHSGRHDSRADATALTAALEAGLPTGSPLAEQGRRYLQVRRARAYRSDTMVWGHGWGYPRRRGNRRQIAKIGSGCPKNRVLGYPSTAVFLTMSPNHHVPKPSSHYGMRVRACVRVCSPGVQRVSLIRAHASTHPQVLNANSSWSYAQRAAAVERLLELSSHFAVQQGGGQAERGSPFAPLFAGRADAQLAPALPAARAHDAPPPPPPPKAVVPKADGKKAKRK
jgi:hypothetical protein